MNLLLVRLLLGQRDAVWRQRRGGAKTVRAEIGMGDVAVGRGGSSTVATRSIIMYSRISPTTY